MEQKWRALLACVASSVLAAALTACSDNGSLSQEHADSTGVGEGGAGGCGADTGATGAGGALQVDDPCASLTAPGASEARVVWVTGGDQSLNVSSDESFLWSFQYAVRVPQGHQDEYSLVHERCETPAGGRTSCSSGELALSGAECRVSYAPKFGVDPGQYEPGKNIYEFALRLMRGCRVASADAFTIALTYTP